jgi:hypothetical protein
MGEATERPQGSKQSNLNKARPGPVRTGRSPRGICDRSRAAEPRSAAQLLARSAAAGPREASKLEAEAVVVL